VGGWTPHPSRALAANSNDSVEIARLELAGDADRLRDWLGDQGLPITVDPGSPAVTKVVLSAPDGNVSIDATFR
jgi:hypothetical protein